MTKLDELLAEVQRLREAAEPADTAGLVKAANAERDSAQAQRDQAIAERDKAIKELAAVKASVEWTMGKLRISDILFLRSEELPAAKDGWLEGWGTNPEDSHRVAWINKYGRVSLHDHNIIVALPWNIDPEQEIIPEIYNIRHFVDICRKTFMPDTLPPAP